MRASQPPSWSVPLADVVGERLGLHFPPERAADLVRGVGATARELGFESPEACARWLLQASPSSDQIDTLAKHLTVGETYFFRDRRAFELIETRVIPELVHRRGAAMPLRCWSAGCCTGEEAYSLAITVGRVTAALHLVNVLGTDLNRAFLEVATAGVFGPWSFRDVPRGAREAYFHAAGPRRWRIDDALRSRVTFRPLNLVTDPYPSVLNGTHAVDLILCRNVLIYFSATRATEVVRALARCLAPGGWLILAPTETARVDCPDLEAVRFPDAIFYRRRERAEPSARPVHRSPEPLPTNPIVPSAPPTPSPDIEPPQPAPRAANGLLESARDFADQGLLDRALVACDEALRTTKTSHRAHHLRAEILQELGRTTEAREAFGRALYLQPDFVPAHFALGHLALARGRHREARRHFANTLALLRDHPADEVIPDSGGLTSGRIVGIAATLQTADSVHR